MNVVDPRRGCKLALELLILTGYGQGKTDYIDAVMLAKQTHRCLAPVENQSASRKGSIKLNRHCNYYLKNASVQAANPHNYSNYRRK